MRVVAYSIKNFEKESLAKANQKKHDITLISNSLSVETAVYAEGKDAIIVFTNDNVSAPVIHKLADQGIKYIITRSVDTEHINYEAATQRNIKIAHIPAYPPEAVSEYVVMLALNLSRKLIASVDQSRKFNFSIDHRPGFTFHGKTVGIIGLSHTGLATASIFNGFGCKILGYDIVPFQEKSFIESVSLDTLLKESDIISLHIPLVPHTHHFIREATIAKMKRGVMLINTSEGGLINTEDALKALDHGKIGYLGLDVYEHEKCLFFSDHPDGTKDFLLECLLTHPNAIVTLHQAFLTREAIEEIATQTIQNLDIWQENKLNAETCTIAGENEMILKPTRNLL